MKPESVSRLQLEALCDQLTDTAVCFLDAQGCVADWNAGAARFFGVSETEAMQHSLAFFFTAPPWEAALLEATQKGMYSGEWPHRDYQRSAKRIFVEIRPIIQQSELLGYSLICRNLHYDQQVGSDGIRALPIGTQQHLFEQLVEHSYSGITLFNADYRMVYRSPSAARITGFSDSDRSQSSINDMIHPADRATVKTLLDELLRHPGCSRTCCFRSYHASGRYIDLECVFTNWLEEAAIQAIVLNFRDISDKKKSEEYLQQAL